MRLSLAAALLCTALHLSWSSAEAQPAPLRLAVSDGRTGSTSMIEVWAKYEPLAEVFSRALGGRKIVMVQLREFGRLDEAVASREFDLMVLRPADRAATAIGKHGYRLVATAKPDIQCVLLVRGNSPVRSLDQVKGARIAMGEPDAYLTRICRADLLDRGIDLGKERVQYTREQQTIGILLEGALADVGGVAQFSPLARNWEQRGHRIVHRSVPQPSLPIIAGPRLSDVDVRSLREELLALGRTSDGRAILKSLAVDAFVATEEARIRALPAWIER